jgi:hypothetical protein
MTEIWKPVAEVPRYEVSNLGRVRIGKTILKPWAKGRNLRVNLRLEVGRDARSVNRYVRGLVAAAFLPPRPSPLHAVQLKDNNASNLAASNLYWGLTKRASRLVAAPHHVPPRAPAAVTPLTKAQDWNSLAKRFAANQRKTG